MYRSILTGALALAGSALVAAQRQSPCAAVAEAQASYLSDSQDPFAAVPADLAIACLNSVPLQKEENKLLIQEMKLYLMWQSTVSYLKTPPEGYTGDAVDIIASMDDIARKLDNDEYSNEFEFQQALFLAIRGAYDFHLVWMPDIFSVFLFQRGNVFTGEEFALVSASADGTALPQLYNYFDVRRDVSNASPITEINNQTAGDYVVEWSKTSPFHDKDARFNRQFVNQAGLSYGDEVNEFVVGILPDGPTTSVAHENGTSLTYDNYARVLVDFSGIDSGEAFFQTFCNQGPPPPPTQSKGRRSLDKRQGQQPSGPVGYPEPVIAHDENVVGGYYLTGQGYDDVAVLGIPSFGPNQVESATQFQEVVRRFLTDATTNGKKRLVIDLRSNGGGRVFLGYDLFKQLFPQTDPWGATRFRANEAFNVAGIAMTEKLSGFTYDDAVQDFQRGSYNGLLALAWASIFNYKLPRNSEGKEFSSWEDLFGPHEFNGDRFTSLERYDFNNFFSDDLDMDVTGFRSRSDLLMPAPPFAAENIVLLQDGSCGSTCAIFAELMKAQARVQQVVVGGQPATGPMQSVAGSKGAQVWTFDQVLKEAATAYNFLSDYRDQLNGTEIGDLVFAERPLKRSAYGADGRSRSVINLRDNIRAKDTTNTPLEFVYEAADCRLFYTPDMLRDAEAVWRAAVDARWADNRGCVEGSTGAPSSVQGGADLPGEDLEAGAGALRGHSAAALVVAVVASVWAVGF